MGIGEERQTGTLLAGNTRVDPEIRDLLRPPCGGAEAIAWQAPPPRPWKGRFRDIDPPPPSADCPPLGAPPGPQETARRGDRHPPPRGVGVTGVVRIVDPAETVRAEAGFGRGAGDIEERPHQLDSGSEDPPPPHARKRPRSGSSEEPQKKCFRLVPARVRRRDDGGASR